jgi:nucleotide-binding universal stress UspA family protein
VERRETDGVRAKLTRPGQQHAAVVAREGAQLAGSLGLDAEPLAIPDEVHVADAIVDLAVRRNAAALLIGSHSISGVRSHLLGSISRPVLARCKRPVVVVRADESR